MLSSLDITACLSGSPFLIWSACHTLIYPSKPIQNYFLSVVYLISFSELITCSPVCFILPSAVFFLQSLIITQHYSMMFNVLSQQDARQNGGKQRFCLVFSLLTKLRTMLGTNGYLINDGRIYERVCFTYQTICKYLDLGVL